MSRACFCIYLHLNILSRQRRWIQNEKPLAQTWNCKNIASRCWEEWIGSQNQIYFVKYKWTKYEFNSLQGIIWLVAIILVQKLSGGIDSSSGWKVAVILQKLNSMINRGNIKYGHYFANPQRTIAQRLQSHERIVVAGIRFLLKKIRTAMLWLIMMKYE